MENFKGAIAQLRREFMGMEFLESGLSASPFAQFAIWFNDAIKAEIQDANAMTLATASLDGIPTARIVLLKDFSEEGFVFFGNYASKKGQELSANPNASLLFYWKELARQVRITGTVKKVSREESVAYFNSRPDESKVSAIASPQSAEITKEELELNRHKVNQLTCPETWGGYILLPSYFEFWQGRPNRFHDRLVYEKAGNAWRIFRIAP